VHRFALRPQRRNVLEAQRGGVLVSTGAGGVPLEARRVLRGEVALVKEPQVVRAAAVAGARRTVVAGQVPDEELVAPLERT
jgi:hypothetical protein